MKEAAHIGEINEVLTYLDSVILEDWSGREAEFREMTSIENLARISCLSKRNLQLYFQAYVHETVGMYRNRLRLEYAQQLLKDGQMNINEISEFVGFANPPAFHNNFQKLYHESPLERQSFLLGKKYSRGPVGKLEYRKERLEYLKVAYISCWGSYDLEVSWRFEEDSWDRLEAYAERKGLLTGKTTYWGIAYDDTDITEEDKCRFDVALSIRNSVKLPITEKVKVRELPSGDYAVFVHKGDYACLAQRYETILQTLDFDLGNTPFLEKYLNSPFDAPQDELLTEIWVPMG